MISISEQEMFKTRGQRFMRWARGIVLITGILALSYVAFTLISARIYQENAILTLEKQIHEEEQHKAGLPG